ncbi:adenosylmethionine decarboxylase [bacterium]|nr:adenosylmethionine decarboxylase [bacterium]
MYQYPLMELQQPLGRHTLVEYIEADREILSAASLLEPILLEAVRVCGATYIAHQVNQFEPYGASGVVLIAESHLSFHSWPEHGYMAMDLFTCSLEMDPTAAIQYVAERIRAARFTSQVITRGF